MDAKSFLTFDGTLSSDPTQHFFAYKLKNQNTYLLCTISYLDTLANDNLVMIDGLAELQKSDQTLLISDYAYQVYTYRNLLIHIDSYADDSNSDVGTLYDTIIQGRELILDYVKNHVN